MITIGRDDTQVTAVTAVGTTQSGGAALRSGVNVLTSTAGQTAAVLPANAAGPLYVRVTGGTTATVFPPVGGSIDGGTVNTSVNVASAAKAMFVPHPNGLDYTLIS